MTLNMFKTIKDWLWFGETKSWKSAKKRALLLVYLNLVANTTEQEYKFEPFPLYLDEDLSYMFGYRCLEGLEDCFKIIQKDEKIFIIRDEGFKFSRYKNGRKK